MNISKEDKDIMMKNYEIQKRLLADIAKREAHELAKRLASKAKRGFLKKIFSWFGIR